MRGNHVCSTYTWPLAKMFETHLPQSHQWSKLHKVSNSSTNDSRYTSMLSFVIDSFFGINRDNITKNHLVVNHGGKLQLRRSIGHVEWFVDKFAQGITLSRGKHNLMLQRSITKSGQVLSMCFQAFESHTKQTDPSLLMFALCQNISSPNFDHLYIFSRCGIKGKWQITL